MVGLGLLQQQYSTVRRQLDKLGYKEAFPVDALSLVERLLTDLVKSNDELTRATEISNRVSKIAQRFENGVEPFKEESVRLTNENSKLRLEILKIQEEADEAILANKSRLLDLESTNIDLKLLVNQFIDRLKRLEFDSLQKTKKLALAHEQNLEAVIISSDGDKRQLSTRKQRMEINCNAVPICPHCVRIRNFVEFGGSKNREPRALDYLKIADSRIECLQLLVRKCRNEKDNLQGIINCLRSKISDGEPHVGKDNSGDNCSDSIQLTGTGSYEIAATATRDYNITQALKTAQMQLNILQKRNIDLEAKLKSSIMNEHHKYIGGQKMTKEMENEILDGLIKASGGGYPTHEELTLEQKNKFLEAQLSHCCEEKAKLKFLLEQCEEHRRVGRGRRPMTSPVGNISRSEPKIRGSSPSVSIPHSAVSRFTRVSSRSGGGGALRFVSKSANRLGSSRSKSKKYWEMASAQLEEEKQRGKEEYVSDDIEPIDSDLEGEEDSLERDAPSFNEEESSSSFRTQESEGRTTRTDEEQRDPGRNENDDVRRIPPVKTNSKVKRVQSNSQMQHSLDDDGVINGRKPKVQPVNSRSLPLPDRSVIFSTSESRKEIGKSHLTQRGKRISTDNYASRERQKDGLLIPETGEIAITKSRHKNINSKSTEEKGTERGFREKVERKPVERKQISGSSKFTNSHDSRVESVQPGAKSSKFILTKAGIDQSSSRPGSLAATAANRTTRMDFTSKSESQSSMGPKTRILKSPSLASVKSKRKDTVTSITIRQDSPHLREMSLQPPHPSPPDNDSNFVRTRSRPADIRAPTRHDEIKSKVQSRSRGAVPRSTSHSPSIRSNLYDGSSKRSANSSDTRENSEMQANITGSSIRSPRRTDRKVNNEILQRHPSRRSPSPSDRRGETGSESRASSSRSSSTTDSREEILNLQKVPSRTSPSSNGRGEVDDSPRRGEIDSQGRAPRETSPRTNRKEEFHSRHKAFSRQSLSPRNRRGELKSRTKDYSRRSPSPNDRTAEIDNMSRFSRKRSLSPPDRRGDNESQTKPPESRSPSPSDRSDLESRMEPSKRKPPSDTREDIESRTKPPRRRSSSPSDRRDINSRTKPPGRISPSPSDRRDIESQTKTPGRRSPSPSDRKDIQNRTKPPGERSPSPSDRKEIEGRTKLLGRRSPSPSNRRDMESRTKPPGRRSRSPSDRRDIESRTKLPGRRSRSPSDRRDKESRTKLPGRRSPSLSDRRDIESRTKHPGRRSRSPSDRRDIESRTKLSGRRSPSPSDGRDIESQTTLPGRRSPSPSDRRDIESRTKLPGRRSPSPSDRRDIESRTKLPGRRSPSPSDRRDIESRTKLAGRRSPSPSDRRDIESRTKLPGRRSSSPSDRRDKESRTKLPGRRSPSPSDRRDIESRTKLSERRSPSPSDRRDRESRTKLPGRRSPSPSDRRDRESRTKPPGRRSRSPSERRGDIENWTKTSGRKSQQKAADRRGDIATQPKVPENTSSSFPGNRDLEIRRSGLPTQLEQTDRELRQHLLERIGSRERGFDPRYDEILHPEVPPKHPPKVDSELRQQSQLGRLGSQEPSFDRLSNDNRIPEEIRRTQQTERGLRQGQLQTIESRENLFDQRSERKNVNPEIPRGVLLAQTQLTNRDMELVERVGSRDRVFEELNESLIPEKRRPMQSSLTDREVDQRLQNVDKRKQISDRGANEDLIPEIRRAAPLRRTQDTHPQSKEQLLERFENRDRMFEQKTNERLIPEARHRGQSEDDSRELGQLLDKYVSRERVLEHEILSLKSSLMSLDRDREQLSRELDRKDVKLTQTQKESEQNVQEISDLQLKLKKSEMQIRHNEDSQQNKERDIALLRRQLENLRKDLEEMGREREELLKRLRGVSNVQTLSDLDRRNIKTELEKRNKEAEDLLAQIQRYVFEVRRCEELLQGKEEENEIILNQYRALRNDFVELENAQVNLERESDSVRQTTRQAVEQNATLKTQLEKQSSLVTAYEEQIARLSHQVAALETQLKTVSESGQIHETDSKVLRDEYLLMEKKLDSLRLELANCESDRNKLDAENCDLRRRNEDLEAVVLLGVQSMKQMEDVLVTYREAKSIQDQKLENITAEKQYLEEQILMLINRNEKLRDELVHYRLKSAETTTELERIQRQLQNEQIERQTAVEEIEHLRLQLTSTSTTKMMQSALFSHGSQSSSPSTGRSAEGNRTADSDRTHGLSNDPPIGNTNEKEMLAGTSSRLTTTTDTVLGAKKGQS